MRGFIFAALVCLFASPADAGSTSLSGLPGQLIAKVKQIQSACGSKVVSTHRRGARTPRGTLSNHALGKAADLQGNPRCIYAKLKGWPGGYSTDYSRAPGGPHVHLSFNRHKEWGLRFAHAGGRHRHRGRVMVASAQPRLRD